MTRRVNPRLPCGEEEERFGGDLKNKLFFFFYYQLFDSSNVVYILKFPSRTKAHKKERWKERQTERGQQHIGISSGEKARQ